MPTIHHGDCIQVMNAMPPESVDAIVTDPPYGISFMSSTWDATPPGVQWAEACYRVLKPGGHIAAFGGTRTWHRLAVAIEDAGFEMRDSLAWLYGSGFPKSHDVGKAIDKLAGVEREVIGKVAQPAGNKAGGASLNMSVVGMPESADITAPATPEAAQWDGWGTALKPAFEPIVLARKPFPGTVARNVLEHGTGAINVDATRIEATDDRKPVTGFAARTAANRAAMPNDRPHMLAKDPSESQAVQPHPSGRWPANVVLDQHAAAWVDEQSGVLKTGGGDRRSNSRGVYGEFSSDEPERVFGANSGGASRFFYTAKAPKRERPNVDGVQHPTVKPLAIMRWLIRLVTPPGGTVLDPFAGSGTTIEAAIIEGFNPVGVEMEADYLPLIQHRIDRQAGTLTA